MTETGADRAIATLAREGVETIFGVPGSALTPLYESLEREPRVGHVLAKHEAGAAFMAGGLARVGRRVGVCWATTGPGATNAVTAIACALADSLPVLIVTGQTPSRSFGRNALQESTPFGVDVVRLFEPVTKLSAMVPSADRIEPLVELALRIATSGRPGPVHLSIPSDVLAAPVAAHIETRTVERHARSVDLEGAAAAARALRGAKAPRIFAGHGVDVSDASAELLALAESLDAPVATTPKGKSVFPESHALSLGVFGFGGHDRAERELCGSTCDVLLVVGSGLGEFATNGWDPRLGRRTLLQIDVDGGAIGRNYPVDRALIGDARATLAAIRRELGPRRECRGPPSATHLRVRDEPAGPALSPRHVVAALRAALPDDGLLFVDNGNSILWGGHYFEARRPHTYFASLGFASMGNAIGAAIGGKLAAPDRAVAALVGDAAFAMSGSDVHTAAEHGVNVVWVVLNDGGHGMVHHGESMIFGHDLGAARFRRSIDVAGFARSLGVDAVSVDDEAELADVLRSAIDRGAPFVVDARVDAAEVPALLRARAQSVARTAGRSAVAPAPEARPSARRAR